MLKKIVLICTVVCAIIVSSFAEKLAIAEPINKGGMPAKDIEAIWGMLEATVDGDYELISRSALKQMMTEIGLTTSSDLMNLNSIQKARLGQIKTVKYLLVPTISKFGSRLNLSLIMVDSSTGEIDPDAKTSETFDSLDEFSDKLKDMLSEIGLGQEIKKRGRSAILVPIIRVRNAPSYLAEDFNAEFENSLLDSGIRLQNLQSVTKILKKNKIDNLYEAEPAMYRRIGELLRVDYLLQATINRFSCDTKKEYIRASKRTVTRVIGNIAGNIRIISAQTGEIAGSIRFREKVNFDDLDSDETDDWTSEDYGIYLIEDVLPVISKKVIPKVK